MAKRVTASVRRAAEALIKRLQRDWRLADWEVGMVWVPEMEAVAEGRMVGSVSWDILHRAATVILPVEADVRPGQVAPRQAFTVAHEMAHLLLVGMHDSFNGAIEHLSEGRRDELQERFTFELERVCNALAGSVTGERPRQVWDEEEQA